ncbi:MAG: hypothetical protein O3A00_04310, partial [Planctomycetota bacterium]|nr:hypothetical protein [Planctomycetota bacterium]
MKLINFSDSVRSYLKKGSGLRISDLAVVRRGLHQQQQTAKSEIRKPDPPSSLLTRFSKACRINDIARNSK